MSVRLYQFEPLQTCSGHVEEDCEDKGKLQIRVNIMNVIRRLSYR